MEQTIKQFYEAPSITVFEVKQKSVICASDPINGGNYPNWDEEDI